MRGFEGNGRRRAARRLATYLLALVAIGTASGARGSEGAAPAGLIAVKMGLNSLSKADRAKLWERVDEYATVDAIQEFCGRKLNLQRRTWAAVAACVEVTSLRRVASVFRAKKAEYLKGWEETHGEPEKKKALCDTMRPRLVEYQKIIDSHISEARTMCSVCIFC